MTTIQDAIANLSASYAKRAVRFRIVARPIAQIVDDKGRVIIESQNEWEVRELYRLIKGRTA